MVGILNDYYDKSQIRLSNYTHAFAYRVSLSKNTGR